MFLGFGSFISFFFLRFHSTCHLWGSFYHILTWVATRHCLKKIAVNDQIAVQVTITCVLRVFHINQVGWRKWIIDLGQKNEGSNKQNAKHVYTERQIHSSNFTLAWVSGHLSLHPETSKEIAFFIIKRLEVSKGLDHFDLIFLSPLASLFKVFRPTQIQDHIRLPREL